jgi:SNF2 family DNA or RNA helicase
MLYIAYANEVEKVMLSARPEDKFKLLAMLTRLRQICCDPALVYEGYEEDSCKLEECVRMLEELLENEHRVLVFSQFTSMLGRIEDRLDKQGIPSFTLRGDTPLDERVRLVNAFNAGARNVFLISLKAGGTGLNLIGADTVIHYDPWWNPAVEDQATDRAYRIGQTSNVYVLKLLTRNSVEENIYKLQQKKKELSDSVIQSKEVFINLLTREELEDIFSMNV